MQQMMLSLGICAGALALNASVAWSGGGRARLSDFAVAFLAVASVSLFASPVCARLAGNAGDDIAGRGGKVQHSGMR
jgi:hypothetical protein